MPFFADMNPPAVVFFAVWLGGSAVAGAVVPRRWMFVFPVAAFAVLLVVLSQGYTDSEFLSDPLSSVGLLFLAAGELAGLAVGYAARRRSKRL